MLLAADRYPDLPAGLANNVAWLALGLVAGIGLWLWSRQSSIRRGLLGYEDPRVYAVLRVGIALMTLQNFWNLRPYWRMLWSDEGLFTLGYAQERLGRTALRGWHPDEGFLDFGAVLNFLWHKPSLLFLHGEPSYVTAYMWVFFAVLVLFALGVGTRVTGVIAWLMMSGLYNRNALFWEGTDTVYRCTWFILLFARTGSAWSVDNVVRCAWHRWRGHRLQSGPVAGDGEVPIYRQAPSWPRLLLVAQVCAIYVTTGMVKTGSVWASGDALYYALNLDHFYRFELDTQLVSYYLATNVFRLSTWSVHWWEMTFAISALGLYLRFAQRNADAPWRRAEDRGWTRWVGLVGLAAAFGCLYAANILAYPYCLKMRGNRPVDPATGLRTLHIVYAVVLPVGVALWAAGSRWRWLRSGMDLVLSRRVWLGLGFAFHGVLIVFMNIGMFPFIMLMTYAAFLRGEEVAAAWRWCCRRSTRLPLPASWRRHAELEATPPIARGLSFPREWVWVLGAIGLSLAASRVVRYKWVGTAAWWWLGAIAATALVCRFWPTRGRAPLGTERGLPGSAIGRTLALAMFTFHFTAVGARLTPSYGPLSVVRRAMTGLHRGWLTGTGTSQSWRMFAPNPPRSNRFMQTLIVEHDGTQWDLRNNAFNWRPYPWIWNDRLRKMQRRMTGKGKWYLKHWVHFQCREWVLAGHPLPKEVIVNKITTPIPKPGKPRDVYYRLPWLGKVRLTHNPRTLPAKTTEVQTHPCKGGGEIQPWMAARYEGLGLDIEVTDQSRAKAGEKVESDAKRWDSRRRAWERRSDWFGPGPKKRKPTTKTVKPPSSSVTAKDAGQ